MHLIKVIEQGYLHNFIESLKQPRDLPSLTQLTKIKKKICSVIVFVQEYRLCNRVSIDVIPLIVYRTASCSNFL